MSDNIPDFLEDNPLAEVLATGTVGGGAPILNRSMKEYLAWTVDHGWLKWDGKVWRRIAEPVAIEMVRRELQALFTSLLNGGEKSPERVNLLKRLLSKRKAADVTYFLKGLLTVKAEKWDSAPDLLNAQNGVIDLRAGALLPHSWKYRMTKISPVEFHADATHPDWTAALGAADDPDYLQLRFGQAATGYPVDDDRIPFQIGGGANGKSTMVNAVMRALGDYAVGAPVQTLLGNAGDHPTELMVLKGARLAVVEELPEGKHLPSRRLKELAGTATVKARRMRSDFEEFPATHSMFVNSNFIPQVSDVDEGTWRRLMMVKYRKHFIHPSEPILSPNDVHGDPSLRERLAASEDGQLEAVLAWIVAGSRRWYETRSLRSTPWPFSIQADTQKWREEADLVIAYARERLAFTVGSAVLVKELFDDFNQWLSDTGRQPVSMGTFKNKFEGHSLFAASNVELREKARPSANLTRRRGVRGLGVIETPAQAHLYLGVAFT